MRRRVEVVVRRGGMSWGVLEGGLLERLGVVEGVVLEGAWCWRGLC